MKDDDWDRFERTGKVEDYLTYKGMMRQETVSDRYQDENRKDEESEPDDYRDRNDSVSTSDWGI